MGRAKDILIKVINSKVANKFVKEHHYSGKVVQNSSLHFGCFLDGKLGGVMSYGSPLDKRKVLPLVEGTLWNEMLELNRMAFSDLLPRNSESRCMAISFKLMKKNAPHIKWILSFSDGTQCGDGTIYRAAGFLLTKIKKNNQIWKAPNDELFSRMSLTDGKSKQQQQRAKTISRVTATKGKNMENGKASMQRYIDAGFTPLEGNQLRYVKLLHQNLKLNCEVLPYSKIDEIGAGMYKGEKISIEERRKKD